MGGASEKLSMHHIGGRFGNGGFPVLPSFEHALVRVYYDADRDCIDQVRERLAGSAAEVRVLPFCVGGTDGRGTLHVNYDTTSSSLYPLNPGYGPFYFFSYNHDFLASDSLRTMERREVDVVSLDRIFRDGVAGAPPDFLSMDVQGAEHAILEGAKETLRTSVLGLVIEAGLHPLYQGQRTFGDVQALLGEAGFHFVQFLGFHDYAPYRAPVGLRGEGFHILTDALFLRRIEDLERTETDAVKRRTLLRKLAFIAIVYGQTEYGLACLERSGKAAQGAAGDRPRYEEFLDEFGQSAARMPARYPKLFSEKYTFELSRRRFSPAASARSGAGMGERLWLRYIYPNIYRIAGLYRFLLHRLWAPSASLLFPGSPAERTLRKYGLTEQARSLKRRRVVETLFSRRT